MLTLTKRFKIVQGGTWAGKTFGIISILIDKCCWIPGRVVTVVAESIPAVKRGPLANFFEIMHATNRWIDDRFNGTERTYHFANGSTMEFTSFDTVGKAQASGKRTDLFLNEAYYLDFEICDALMGRTSGDVWIDYNPHSLFWVNDDILGRDDVSFIILLPGDNEALPETIKADHAIKREKAKTSEYWANWCKVFLDGQPGSSQGAILRNWELGPFDTTLPYHYGLDFGSRDPDALLKMALNRQLARMYAREELYQNSLSTDDLAKLIKSRNVGNTLIVADSAHTRTIQDLRGRGLNVQPVHKGLIVDDIKMLYNWLIVVDPESKNLQKELNNWVWLDKKSETPVDGFDHLIAALRYIARTIIKPIPTNRGQRILK